MRSSRTASLWPSGARCYMRNGAWYARLVAIDGVTGTILDVGPEVAMTQSGTTLAGVSLSGTTMVVGNGGAAGVSGSVESNSMRWSCTFAQLGIVGNISGNFRPYTMRMMTDSMDDNGVSPRVSTAELFCYLGTGAVTDNSAGVGLQRHSSGTLTYRAVCLVSTDAPAGSGAISASASLVGGAIDSRINVASTGVIDLRGVTSTGDAVGGVTTVSTSTVTNSPPTHLVIAATVGTTASDFRLYNPRALVIFGMNATLS